MQAPKGAESPLIEKGKAFALLLEQLLLFDKVAIKITESGLGMVCEHLLMCSVLMHFGI